MGKQIKSGVELGDELKMSVMDTMLQNEERLTPFLSLLWKQQQRYISQGSVRYHPMIIRFALSLAMKPATAYDELKETHSSE